MTTNAYSNIRLVVFDLDETLWSVAPYYCAMMVAPYEIDGDTIRDAEGRTLTLRSDARETLAELKRRGYRISAASRNQPDIGRQILELLGIWEYFTHPCLEWQDKDESLVQVLRDFREKGPEPYEPEEALFIDDWPGNIADAASVGVRGLIYGWQLEALSDVLDLLPEEPGGS